MLRDFTFRNLEKELKNKMLILFKWAPNFSLRE